MMKYKGYWGSVTYNDDAEIFYGSVIGIKDLIKAEKGNKTAAQRVRTGTIKFEKVAKKYRKESMKSVKKKTTRKKKKKTAKKKTARRKRH